MASHKLAIAKATFAASLLRPDPATSPLSREDASRFNTLLDAAIVQCSPLNVQACRKWLCHNIIPSESRTTALGKLFVVAAEQNDKIHTNGHGTCSMRRLRLHLLYIVNDVLHWFEFHNSRATSESIPAALISAVQRVLCISAARDQSPKHRRTLSDLLALWHRSHYFSDEELDDLKTSFQQACEKGEGALDDPKHDILPEQSKDAPWIMPATHGDPSTPYYDLPAANMMPLIHPNSTEPIETHRMKALQFTRGPADASLISAVQEFLKDVEQIYNPKNEVGAVIDIDAMGQEIIVDEMGDRIGEPTYYGWSRAFCEKMKRRAAGGTEPIRGRSRSRSRSYSDSDQSRGSFSRVARKRRRSGSGSPSRSRSRTRRRSRYSSSRSRSRSNVRKQSPTPRRGEESRLPAPMFNNQAHALVPPPPPPSFGFQQSIPPPGLLSYQGNIPIPPPPMGMPLIHNGIPIPPPRPANWTGPWPPPPPPLPGSSSGLQFSPGMTHPLPPPPPPPPNQSLGGSWNGVSGRGNRTQDPRRR